MKTDFYCTHRTTRATRLLVEARQHAHFPIGTYGCNFFLWFLGHILSAFFTASIAILYFQVC